MSTHTTHGGGLPTEIVGGTLILWVWGLNTRTQLLTALSLGECSNHLLKVMALSHRLTKASSAGNLFFVIRAGLHALVRD